MLGCWLLLPPCGRITRPETTTNHPESSTAAGSVADVAAMDKREAKLLFERCLPKFVEAGLQVISDISDVKVKEIASLWAGMGPLVETDGVWALWWSGWWFGTFFIFPYIGNNHPNWLIFFRGVETTNQWCVLGETEKIGWILHDSASEASRVKGWASVSRGSVYCITAAGAKIKPHPGLQLHLFHVCWHRSSTILLQANYSQWLKSMRAQLCAITVSLDYDLVFLGLLRSQFSKPHFWVPCHCRNSLSLCVDSDLAPNWTMTTAQSISRYQKMSRYQECAVKDMKGNWYSFREYPHFLNNIFSITWALPHTGVYRWSLEPSEAKHRGQEGSTAQQMRQHWRPEEEGGAKFGPRSRRTQTNMSGWESSPAMGKDMKLQGKLIQNWQIFPVQH